jgi:tRNA G18 (ribose-2'-O)-methylase SpoU
MPPTFHVLTDAHWDDERLRDYRDLRDRQLAADSGRFVAESERIVAKLLGTDLEVESVLLTAPRLASLEAGLTAHPRAFPVYLAPQSLMDRVAGFHVHRGCLAIAKRPARTGLPTGARRLAVAVDLVDVDNLGSLARNAAALGMDGLLLSPRCADPFYRKAVRTSAGAVLTLPIWRARAWPDELIALREREGFSLVGAALSPRAIPLARFAPPPRVALLVGSEGPGLDPATLELCDALVTIPMATSPGVDSLNVATAAAVIFHWLDHAGSPD